MSIEEGFVTTEDGVRLFYQALGSGPQAVVLLNGLFLFDEFKFLAGTHQLISLDLRNRGRSDYITDRSKLEKGILHDVDDLEAVRRHLGIQQMALIGHSYAAVIPILYALKYPDWVNRIVQIGALSPNPGAQYSPSLTNADAALTQFFAKIEELEKERQSTDPAEFCRKFWEVLRMLYVADPANADKLRHWEHCDLPTELNLMPYWLENLMPSIQTLVLTPGEIGKVKAEVLVIHGREDRSAPYGGGRDWAALLPNARLLTVENAAHAPWIEVPEVLDSVRIFLDGAWPEAAEKVEA